MIGSTAVFRALPQQMLENVRTSTSTTILPRLCAPAEWSRRASAYGATDNFGKAVVAQPLPVHDNRATILHQLGIVNTRLTYTAAGTSG